MSAFLPVVGAWSVRLQNLLIDAINGNSLIRELQSFYQNMLKNVVYLLKHFVVE